MDKSGSLFYRVSWIVSDKGVTNIKIGRNFRFLRFRLKVNPWNRSLLLLVVFLLVLVMLPGILIIKEKKKYKRFLILFLEQQNSLYQFWLCHLSHQLAFVLYLEKEQKLLLSIYCIISGFLLVLSSSFFFSFVLMHEQKMIVLSKSFSGLYLN